LLLLVVAVGVGLLAAVGALVAFVLTRLVLLLELRRLLLEQVVRAV
jgi:hypothetical protein